MITEAQAIAYLPYFGAGCLALVFALAVRSALKAQREDKARALASPEKPLVALKLCVEGSPRMVEFFVTPEEADEFQEHMTTSGGLDPAEFWKLEGACGELGYIRPSKINAFSFKYPTQSKAAQAAPDTNQGS